MYQCGDRVVYGIHGVCCILDVELRTIDRKKVEYFVLSPLDQPDARFFVPTQNKAAIAKLRPVLTEDQLVSVLRNGLSRHDCWIADENMRKQKYRELISSANTAEMVSMVRALHVHRKEQVALGRKFHLCDENFLKDAEKLLVSEFSMVLNISAEQVKDYIHKIVKEFESAAL